MTVLDPLLSLSTDGMIPAASALSGAYEACKSASSDEASSPLSVELASE